MQRTTPPFRADHVGSLLRPAALKEARVKRAKGEIAAAQLKAVEDREIEKVIKKQEDDRPQARDRRRVPPLVVAFRFLLGPATASSLISATADQVPRRRDQGRGASRSPARSTSPAIRSSSISGSSRRTATVTPKMTIPAPSTFHFRQGRACGQQARSIPTSTSISPTSPRPSARRSAPSTTPAAATCSSTTPPGR